MPYIPSPAVQEWEAQVSSRTGQPYKLPPEHRGQLRRLVKRCGLLPQEAASVVSWGFLCGLVGILDSPAYLEYIVDGWQGYKKEVSCVGEDIGSIIVAADSVELALRNERSCKQEQSSSSFDWFS